jgi:hypothetical protein
MPGMFAWIVSHPFAYPALEVVHIVGIALLLGNLVLFELRVWGFGPELIGASGLLMFAGQPAELLASRVFVIKMGLVMLAGLNAAWFHARGSLELLDREARFQTVVSMGLWLAVIICGRWIAYA